jgi:hypothetical protein
MPHASKNSATRVWCRPLIEKLSTCEESVLESSVVVSVELSVVVSVEFVSVELDVSVLLSEEVSVLLSVEESSVVVSVEESSVVVSVELVSQHTSGSVFVVSQVLPEMWQLQQSRVVGSVQ